MHSQRQFNEATAEVTARASLAQPPRAPEEVLSSFRDLVAEKLREIYSQETGLEKPKQPQDVGYQMLNARTQVYYALAREGNDRYLASKGETVPGPGYRIAFSEDFPRRAEAVQTMHAEDGEDIVVVCDEIRVINTAIELWIHSVFLYPEEGPVVSQKCFEYILALKECPRLPA